MRQAISILAMGIALATAPLAAQARPIHHAKTEAANPAAKARRAVLDGFAARMGRLDALMGSAPVIRTRSASAER